MRFQGGDAAFGDGAQFGDLQAAEERRRIAADGKDERIGHDRCSPSAAGLGRATDRTSAIMLIRRRSVSPRTMAARRLAALLRADRTCGTILRAVRSLNLPDGAVGAGFIRSIVWDAAHGFVPPTPVPDIDILYFDSRNLSRGREAAIERALHRRLSGLPVSVRNQARMHRRNRDAPYRDTPDALRFWLETATCVAVRLNRRGAIDIVAPYGLDDLLALCSRPTPAGRRKPEQYAARMAAKNWPAIWPRVRVEIGSNVKPGRRCTPIHQTSQVTDDRPSSGGNRSIWL